MNNKENNEALSYFRIKTEWVAAGETGELSKVKTEELVMAANYTDAEKTAYAIAEDQNRYEFGSVNIEIIKTKISSVEYNDVLAHDEALVNGLISTYFEEDSDTGAGLYAVKAIVFVQDEKSGKIKNTTEVIYMPATSSSDAISRVNEMLHKSMSDFVVRDAKFDNAAAIYWSKDVYEQKVQAFDAA